MRLNSKTTIFEISKELNIGRDTINENILKLKKENRLKRVAGRKDGYWEVVDDK